MSSTASAWSRSLGPLAALSTKIERALAGEDSHPFEVAVKWAKSKEEMEEPLPKPERTVEELPWAEIAERSAEE